MSEQIFHIGVKGLIRNKKGDFLLLNLHPKQLRDDKSRSWDVPGGRMDPGEDFETTLAREIKEELGIVYDSKPEFFTATLTNIHIPTDRGEVRLVLMFYLLSVPDGAKITLSGEHTKYEWVDARTAAAHLKEKYSDQFAQQMLTRLAA